MAERTYEDCAVCEGPIELRDGAWRHLMEHAGNQHEVVRKAVDE